MKKSLVLALVLTLAFSVAASAEYGTWEKLHALGGPPGLSNAAFMSLGIGDLDHLYTAGMQQTSAFGITWAWRSTNGGSDWDAIFEMSISGDGCDILELMSFVLTAGASSAETAMFAGIRVSPECIEENEMPACLFKCIFQMEPVMYITDDAGETFQEAELNGLGMYSMIMAIDFVDDTVGYAVGMPGVLMRTQDGGHTWNKINAPGNLLSFYNGVQFLDADTGFVVSGMPEEEKAATSDPQERYDRLVHQARLIKDPVYKLQYQSEGGGKGTNGKAWRTDDGGRTWVEILDTPAANLLNIAMVDGQTGFILGEPHSGDPMAVWRTTDGENFEDITANFDLDLGPVLAWAVAALDFQPVFGDVGFIGGAGQKFTSFIPVLFYTLDGGDTWEFDEGTAELGNPILQLKWATPKIAYSVGFDLSVFRYTQDNLPPIADAGEDADGAIGATVPLDGSGSIDYDEDVLTYAWAQLEGPTATIADATAEVTTFEAAAAGAYTFELVVDDGNETDADTVTFTIADDVPTDDDATDDDATDDDATDDDATDDDATDDDATDDDATDDDAADDDDDDDDSGCGC